MMTKSLARFPLFLALVSSVACGASGSAGGLDPFEKEGRGSRFHKSEVSDFDIERFARGGTPNPAAVGSMFEAAVAESVGALRDLDASDFAVAYSSTEETLAGTRLAHVRLQQQVAGVPVWGSYVSMTAKAADVRGGATLLASSHHVYSGVHVPTNPELSSETAAGLAFVANDMSGSRLVSDSELMLWPLAGRLELVWSIHFEDSHHRELVFASGEKTGRVKRIDERVFETSGTVTADVAFRGAPGGSGLTSAVPLANARVSADGVASITDGNGRFIINVSDGTLLSAALAGLATVGVADETGGPTLVEARASAITDLHIGDASDVLSVANNTAYFFTDRVRAYADANGLGDPALDELAITTNLFAECNAFYQGSGPSINFQRAGSFSGRNCNNTASATIIVHEYGHFLDDVHGRIGDRALSEGWGDLLACLVTDQPAVGPDFFRDPDESLRSCDNDYQFQPGSQDGIHTVGQAWSGFGYHAREGLIAKLGESAGDALARALILPSLVSDAADIPSAVREVFLRDDDDADLTNETPNWDVLIAAAELHNLGFIVDPDLTPPAPTSDLVIAQANEVSATITWTAPGDDGTSGRASFYDIRRSRQPITATNFAQATPIANPPPLSPRAPGTSQAATVGLIPGETAYFALRAFDENNNGSEISNVLEVASAAGTVLYSESFENGAAGWQADSRSQWHVSDRRSSDGGRSFWFGDEVSKKYRPGSDGALVSPPITLPTGSNPILVFSTRFELGGDFSSLRISVFDANDGAFIDVEDSIEETVSGGFVGHTVDVSEFRGRTVRIRFYFRASRDDPAAEGWFIDNVRIINASPGASPTLMINELLADINSDSLLYDANLDGRAFGSEDTFIELLNVSGEEMDLGGVTIDGTQRDRRFTFPDGARLSAGESVVVFDGGSPRIGAQAYIGHLQLQFSPVFTVHAASGEVLDSMALRFATAHVDQSLNRLRDGDPTSPFVRHTKITPWIFSPGAKADRTPFGDFGSPSLARLIINEVLADPGAQVDSNGDGVASPLEDEFIEFINVGDEAIDLSGATLADRVGVRFTMPSGTVVPPQGVVVVFGGMAPQIDGVTTVSGPGQLFLNNSGDSLTLVTADGRLLTSLDLDGANDQSLNRATDLDADAPMVNHQSLSSERASPGRRIDLSAF